MRNRSDNCDFWSNVILVIGACLINFPNGIGWYYGNLSTYLNSYIVFINEPKGFDISTIWILGCLISFFTLGTMIVDLLEKIMNPILINLTAAILCAIGMYTSYIALEYYTLSLLIATFSIPCGLSVGILGMQILKCVIRKSPKQIGVSTAIVVSSVGIGAIIFNIAVINFVNPKNLTPDLRIGNMVYFSQISVLEKVPKLFIVIGSISFGCHFTGILLQIISYYMVYCATKKASRVSLKEKSPVAIGESKGYDYETISSQESRLTQQAQIKEIEMDAPYRSFLISTEKSTSNLIENKTKLNISDRDGSNGFRVNVSENAQPGASSLKALEVLKSRSCLKVFAAIGLLSYGMFMTINYYKSFGQLWIHDDKLLSIIGILNALCSSVGRFFVGILIERKGVYVTMLIMLTINVIGMNLWYFSPQINRWLYLICCPIIVGLQSTIYALCPLSALKLYGPEYHGANTGLLMLPNVLLNLFVLPPLFSSLIDNCGWFSVVFLGNVASVLVIIYFVYFMSRWKRRD